MKSLIWIAALGAGGYALYEWLLTQCATSGSSLYGGQICGYISQTVAPAASAIVSTATPGTNPTPAQQSNPVVATPVLAATGTGEGLVHPSTLCAGTWANPSNTAEGWSCIAPGQPLPPGAMTPGITAGPGFFANVNAQYAGLSGNRIPSRMINRRIA